DFLAWARIKGNQPFVAPDVSLGFILRLQPRIAQLDADGTAAALAQAVEDQPRVHFGEVMESSFGGIGWVRRELGLETQLDPGRGAGIALKTEILVQNPQKLRRKAAM